MNVLKNMFEFVAERLQENIGDPHSKLDKDVEQEVEWAKV